MKYLLRPLAFLVFCNLFTAISLQAQDNKIWQIGPRAGVIVVPYELYSRKRSSGAYIGLQVSQDAPIGTKLSFSLDYGKVSNLRLQRLSQQRVFLPSSARENYRFETIDSYSAIRASFRLDPGFLQLRRFRLGFSGGVSWLSSVGGSLLTRDFNAQLGFGLSRGLDNINGSSVFTGGNTTVVNEAVAGSVLLRAGVILNYQFTREVVASIGLFFDATDRFSSLSGSTDARLTHIQVGFEYPFSTIFKRQPKL